MESVTCPNCGAGLKFKPDTYSQLCDYCGSKFQFENRNDELIDDTCLLPFKIEKKQFKKEALEWLIIGDYVPANILSGSEFGSIEQHYVPVYYFKGTCSGSWNGYLKPNLTGVNKYLPQVFKKRKKPYGNGSVSESFNTISIANLEYKTDNGNNANTRSINQNELENSPLITLLNNVVVIEDDMVPAQKQAKKTYMMGDFELTQDQSWDMFGKSQTARSIQGKFAGNLEEKEIDLAVEYDNASVSKIYLPVWIMSVYFNGVKRNIYMNGITGEIAGRNVLDISLIPRKKNISMPALFIGLSISFLLYLLRFFLPDGKTNLSQHNNILLSPALGYLWYIRLALLWIVLPVYLTRRFYVKKSEAAKNKLFNKRKSELDSLNSGKSELKYILNESNIQLAV